MKKFFATKKNRLTVAVILLLIVVPAIYSIVGIIENARLAAGAYSTAVYFPAYPAPQLTGKNPQQIATIHRGEYLVKVGDCIACHTNTEIKGPVFAGGLAMATAFGTIYSPNITPDKATGIGGWTDEQFITAMRQGISPSGEYYYPAFPYIYFNQVTPDDLKAIKAYLGSIPAINLPNKKNAMVWPFNWRFLQLGWRVLFFHDSKPFQPSANESTEWNRGAYLVEGLGHCGMCHTPSYAVVSQALSLGAPIQKYNLTGAVIQGYLAPNITKTNLGGIPDNELLQIFTEARLIGGGKVQGPMLEAVHDSLSHLTTADLLAIATYLKNVQSEMPPEPTVGQGAVGEYVYNSYCSGCHAIGVGGAPKFGDSVKWRLLAGSGIKKLYAVAINGGGNMPAKGTCFHCSDNDIKQAVDYMVAAAVNGKVQPAQPAKLTMNEGRQVYQKNCSSCHSSGQKNVPQLGNQQAFKPIVGEGFVKIYQNIVTGQKGHPKHGGCSSCTGDELVAALKFMLQKAAPGNNYILW